MSTQQPPGRFIASGDGYFRRFQDIISHLLAKMKFIDGSLWADNFDETFKQAVNWLGHCGGRHHPT